ncbi:MAG TPA: hypothetical protein DC047_02300 [Blastocatellia bacterium]|nr:hypothetical protein [Blastocatellia bacterium]
MFVVLSPNEISFPQWLLALLLLEIPWLSYLMWKQKRDTDVPLFSMITFVYWIYYALALFWGARTVSGVATYNEQEVSSQAITTALELAVVGIASLWLGMKSGLGRRAFTGRLPELKSGNATTHYLRLLLVVGTALGSWDGFPYLLGDGGRQLLMTIVSVLPVVAFVLLFRRYLRGESNYLDKALVVGFLLLRFVTGVSSGWLGSFASIIIICTALYIAERKRIPLRAVICVVAFTLFFQFGKKEFRAEYWKAQAETSKIDRVTFWTETSLNKWSEALSDPTGMSLNEGLNTSLSRLSLLTQTANVVDLTPSAVPFQYFQLYSYMAVAWIPRAVWPDKPSANEANQFYQLAYGLSTEEGLENVSMAVGVMTEGYISFGWTGVICAMFLIGAFLNAFQNIFFNETSGALMGAIGITLLPQILAIESQLAVYLGGVAQQVLFVLLVMLPVISLRSPRKSLPFTPVPLQTEYSK